jgi:hypothetical protein
MLYPEHKDVLKDKMNRYRTQSLFREFYLQNESCPPIWCLKEEDPQGTLPSLKALYMDVLLILLSMSLLCEPSVAGSIG